MNIKATIESIAAVENAGGQFYLTLPYISAVGSTTEKLSVKVPIKSETASAKDKEALLEAVAVQGGLGTWLRHPDGSIWLTAADQNKV